jgi:hypothetical protein
MPPRTPDPPSRNDMRNDIVRAGLDDNLALTDPNPVRGPDLLGHRTQ